MGENLLRESYIANWKKLPEDAVRIRVARPSILAPSKVLLKDYKNGLIDWNEYTRRFLLEILSNPEAIAKLKEIKALAQEKDVYLICYEKHPPCHRFILMKLIEWWI